MSGAIACLWVFVTVLAFINVSRGQQISDLEKRIAKLEGKKDAE